MSFIKPLQLESFKIVLADTDLKLATALKNMLTAIGFRHVSVTDSGKELLRVAKQESVDFVITDWQLSDMHSSALLSFIRQDRRSPNITLPVMMLTGRAEKSDVEAAREVGFNEFLVKPFSATSIVKRLEYIIERPRPFVLTSQYTGPDRRSRATTSVPRERRVFRVSPERRPFATASELLQMKKPQLWLPDLSLKNRLGTELSSLITPTLLTNAQAELENLSSESQDWIKEDLGKLTQLCNALEQGNDTAPILNEMAELTLTISARAGTFGYSGTSSVAYTLYLICRNQTAQKAPPRPAILRKYIDVLQVLIDKAVKGSPSWIQTVLGELQKVSG